MVYMNVISRTHMTCLPKEINLGLAKPPLNFFSGLSKLELTFFSRIGHRCQEVRVVPVKCYWTMIIGSPSITGPK